MMNDEHDRYEDKPEGGGKKHPRQDRLKLALRENLKRRKSQARGRSERTASRPDADGAPRQDKTEGEPGK